MKKSNKVSQKTASAIVALMLGAFITFSAAMDSFGETNILNSKTDSVDNALETKILERAFADAFSYKEYIQIETVEKHTIKVFDNNDNLIETIELGKGEVIEDSQTKSLVNKAEFLSEFNNVSIYKISI